MEKEKVILLFSDLEGTLLRESDGDYSDDEMFRFLEQIDALQKNMGAKVSFHLVSPIYKSQMEKMVEKIDKNIFSYNRHQKDLHLINPIECACAYPEDEKISYGFNDKRVMDMRKPRNSKEYDSARYGKANYVKNWVETYSKNYNKDLILCIYCGNGRNDLDAMSFIKKTCKGVVICPKNSRTIARDGATFVSEQRDLLGVTEGLTELNKTLTKDITVEDQSESKESDLTN